MTLSPAAIAWHLHGEHGISSRAIFDYLLFGSASLEWITDTPGDADDFRRCELLLRQVPELRTRLHEMARHSEPWARLVARWHDVVALMESELPGVFEGKEGYCRKTDALVSELTRLPRADVVVRAP